MDNEKLLKMAKSNPPPDCWYDDDTDYPVGSCEDCGVNLYADDNDEFCDQCLYMRYMAQGGEG